MKIQVIGISGKSGAGKDFIGQRILRPRGYMKWSLAWAFKNTLIGQHGLNFEEVHTTKPPHVRKVLQEYGQEMKEKAGPNLWIDTARAWMRTMHEENGITKFYVPDIRFPHEADFIFSLGGKMIRVQHGDRPYPLEGTPAAEHPSETAMDPWNMVSGAWDLNFMNNVGLSVREIEAMMEGAGIFSHPLIASGSIFEKRSDRAIRSVGVVDGSTHLVGDDEG